MRTAPATGSAAENRTLAWTVAAYATIFVLKLGVYFMTGVMAVLAEALHTLSDIAISGFLLFVARWSVRAADARHPFGYTRAQNAGALVAATLFVSVSSLRLYEEAVPRLVRPDVADHRYLPLALGVLAFSMALATLPLVGLLRRRTRSAVARAQMMELLNDELGLVAAFVGTVFLALGYPIADPLAAIAVATLIAVNAAGLFRDNFSLLIGRSPAPALLAQIEELAHSVPGVRGVHELRAEQLGPDLLRATLHLEVDGRLTVAAADEIVHEAQRRIHAALPSSHCIIHLDPAGASREPATASSGPVRLFTGHGRAMRPGSRGRRPRPRRTPL